MLKFMLIFLGTNLIFICQYKDAIMAPPGNYVLIQRDSSMAGSEAQKTVLNPYKHHVLFYDTIMIIGREGSYRPARIRRNLRHLVMKVLNINELSFVTPNSC
ncbi:MAG: hypothetical protein OEZ55_13455, partial [Nitrospinota bacterium]|nr:hypothetical protein [Nitrospinota bacterium]